MNKRIGQIINIFIFMIKMLFSPVFVFTVFVVFVITSLMTDWTNEYDVSFQKSFFTEQIKKYFHLEL